MNSTLTKTETETEEVLPPKDAADFLAVHPETLRRYEKAGKLKSEQTEGGHRRYKKSELQAFKDSLVASGETQGKDENEIKDLIGESIPRIDLKEDFLEIFEDKSNEILKRKTQKFRENAVKEFKLYLGIEVDPDDLIVTGIQTDGIWNSDPNGICYYKINTGYDFGYLVYNKCRAYGLPGGIFYSETLNGKSLARVKSINDIPNIIKTNNCQNTVKEKIKFFLKTGLIAVGFAGLGLMINTFASGIFPWVLPALVLTALASILFLKGSIYSFMRITKFNKNQDIENFIEKIPGSSSRKIIANTALASIVNNYDDCVVVGLGTMFLTVVLGAISGLVIF